ncbi:MAG: family 2A encapsulin nanocompartment cargo protein cysteine desulfurase [Terracidiphilus sp.]|jgi:cysteine desulfurase/selenocysteine lyase
MSTSEPNPTLELDEAAISAARQAVAAALPDVATLTQMANAYFRALPGQTLPGLDVATGSSLAAAQPVSASDSSSPGFGTWDSPAAQASQFGVPAPSIPGPIPASVPMQNVFPANPSAFPQFGVAAPSVPSIPSIDKLPTEADLARLSTVDSASTGLPAGLPAEAGLVGLSPIVSPFAVSPYDAPIPASYSTATLPASPQAAPAQAAPAQPVPAPETSTQFPLSPFSLPLPEFSFPFANFGAPDFQAALPTIPPLPALANDDLAKTALTAASQYYFLEQAGALSQPIGAAPSPYSARQVEPALLPETDQRHRPFDVTSIRRDFPILNEKVNGRPLVWLDNAATTQKPQVVIDRLSWFYEHENSNIHRAAHELAARATDAYEDARNKVAHFLKASTSKEIVFVRGATEAINLVAQSWGRRFIGKDDEIVISWIEHHANIVPWQMLAQEKGARLRVIPVDDTGQILLDEYQKLLNERTKLVSFAQVSNALGTVTPVNAMVQMAHRYGARVLVDGAQAVSHMPIDVQEQDCDFFVFSGHKVFGPTGIGVVYGKQDVLADMPPWQGGGNMIVDVTFEKTSYQAPPGRFEAGTGNIADAVGLGAAIAYVERIGMENIALYEHDLLLYATKELLKVPGLHIIGTAKEKAGVLSFVLDGYRTEEVGAALNKEGIAVRSGHHCAQPALRRFGQETTVRPSLAVYNTYDDIDALIAALRRLR